MKRFLFSILLLISVPVWGQSHHFDKRILLAELKAAKVGSYFNQQVAYFLRENKFQELAWQLEEYVGHDFSSLAEELKVHLSMVLAKSKILSKKPLRGGISHTELFTYQENLKGVMKWNHYKKELAAYVVDQMAGFRLVPLTVERFLNGKGHSIQYFVKGASFRHKKRSARLEYFDYLIANGDRHDMNSLTIPPLHRLVAIDHNLAFSMSSDGYRGAIKKIKDKPLLENLLNTSVNTWQVELENYLTQKQLRRFFKRLDKSRTLLINRINQL